MAGSEALGDGVVPGCPSPQPMADNTKVRQIASGPIPVSFNDPSMMDGYPSRIHEDYNLVSVGVLRDPLVGFHMRAETEYGSNEDIIGCRRRCGPPLGWFVLPGLGCETSCHLRCCAERHDKNY